MAKKMHAILIEGGSAAMRMDRAVILLKEHFEDDPEAGARLDSFDAFEDLVILEPLPERRDIVVDQVIELINWARQKPFASTGRACIIPGGERLSEPVQNKLLKLLEEPAIGYIIIILTENAERLLPTIRSRCMRIWLGYDTPVWEPFREDLKILTSALIYKKGSLAEAAQVLSHYEGSGEDTGRDEAKIFLCAFQLFLRNILMARFSEELLQGGASDVKWLLESAKKVRQKDANSMQRGILKIEKAITDINRGYNARYVLRGMALAMRVE